MIILEVGFYVVGTRVGNEIHTSTILIYWLFFEKCYHNGSSNTMYLNLPSEITISNKIKSRYNNSTDGYIEQSNQTSQSNAFLRKKIEENKHWNWLTQFNKELNQGNVEYDSIISENN